MFHAKTSIAVVVAVAVGAAAALGLGVIAWLTYHLEEENGMEELHEDHVETVNQMALGLALPVWNFDHAQIEKIVEGNMQDRDNYAIVVQLADVSHTVYARGRDAAWNVCPISGRPVLAKGVVKETRPIIAGGSTLGTVTVIMTPRFLQAELRRNLAATILEITVFVIALAFGLYQLLWRMVLKPLKVLERDATRAGIGEGQSMGLRGTRFRGELESLRASLETMFGLLEKRYEQLHESEERYRNLNAAAFEGIGISEDGRIVDVNEQMLHMFGYERSEMIGRLIIDMVAPESRAVVAEAIRENREAIYEHRLLRKDGSSFFAEARARIVKLGGRTLRMSAVRDISERKLSEELSRTQSKVLEMVTRGEPLEKILDALLRMIEAQSPEMLCSIVLLDAEGKHIYHAAAPSLPPEYINSIDGLAIGPCAGSCGTAAYRKERVFVADIETDPLWVDYKHLALPHGLRACWSTPILDAQGKVLGTFAIYYRSAGLPNQRHLRLIDVATYTAAVSISKLKTDEALHESEERFRALVEFSPECIAVAVDERLVYVNPAGLKMIRAKTLDEVIGRYTLDFAPAELREAFRKRRKIVLERGMSSPVIEFPLLRLDGSRVTVESLAVPFIFRGKPAILNIIRDITERKRSEAERTEAASREKQAREQFTHLLISSQEAERQRIAGELHDSLAQNLSIIKNRARIAGQQSSIPPAVANHLEAIERIVSDAIAETRNLAHNLRPLHIEQVGLTDSLRELIRETSQSTGIRFERRVENVDEVFRGESATNVYRIVQEALGNLIKHSRAHQAVVTIERDVRSVHLHIADDGVGFDSKEAGSRRGLGLTSMTERVRMLGGKLHLKSSPGKGTELIIDVPFSASGEDGNSES